jgi:hypothetical protein
MSHASHLTLSFSPSQVDRLLAHKGNSFEHAVIYRVSVAAAPLASWVKANMAFSKARGEEWGKGGGEGGDEGGERPQ